MLDKRSRPVDDFVYLALPSPTVNIGSHSRSLKRTRRVAKGDSIMTNTAGNEVEVPADVKSLVTELSHRAWLSILGQIWYQPNIQDLRQHERSIEREFLNGLITREEFTARVEYLHTLRQKFFTVKVQAGNIWTFLDWISKTHQCLVTQALIAPEQVEQYLTAELDTAVADVPTFTLSFFTKSPQHQTEMISAILSSLYEFPI